MLSSLSRLALVLVAWALLVYTVAAWQAPSAPASGERAFRIIVVESADAAEGILARLGNGEDFATLAQRISLDPSAANGGFIAAQAVSGLRPELRQAVDGLSLGQVSAVVRLPTGFAVLKAVPANALDTPGAVSAALTSTGNIRYTKDVSGYTETVVAWREQTKPADWNERPDTICAMRRQSTAETRATVSAFLTSASGQRVASADLMQAYFLMGQLDSHDGAMSAAIASYERAYAIASSEYPAARLDMEEVLGVAYLHQAEMENGIYHAPGDRCLLSDVPIAQYEKRASLNKALDHLSRFLDEKPDELGARWLFNLTHMALGSHPAGVPKGRLIPLSAFASTEDVGRFVDVASRAGLRSVASAGGVIVDDFDNDGLLEVVTSDFNSCEPMRFFRRNGGGLFVEGAEKAGLGGQLGGLNAVQADFDNDGALDILLLRGAWEMPQRLSLLRNKGDGTFTDVTVASGLGRPITRTQTAAWADIDRDGYLDVFVGNEDGPSRLFLNRRNGTFEDIAARAGVDRSAFTKAVSAGDYDNDGWPDFSVSNLGGASFLYRNNRDGTFTERAAAAGVTGSGQSFAAWFFDYDNDGWQDIFGTSYFASVDETMRTYLELPHNAPTLKLYRNLGNGTFQDATRQAGLAKVFMPMGANYGDIDNDGFLDIYLGTGNPSYASIIPSVLLRNRNGTSFVDVTASSGTGELHKGHGVAFADLDRDGDQEIVFEVGGATPGDAHALRLFENPGHANDWLTVQLRGVKTNRAAIGARIAVTVENDGRGTRTIHRTVGSGGTFGASPLEQHVGLGRNARIVAVEIAWPTSGTRQRFTNVDKNQYLEITELAADYVRLVRPARPLKGE